MSEPHATPPSPAQALPNAEPALDMMASLADSGALLQMLADLGEVVIWRHDLTTQRIQYNERGYRDLGLPNSAEGVPVDEVRSRLHPDDRARVVASAEQALLTGQARDVEARYLRADGQWRWLLVRRVIQRGPAGEALAFVGVSLDVTERVEQVRRAEQLAHRLDTAARAARIGIWSTTIGSTLQTEWNAQMYELFDRVGGTHPPTLAEWLRDGVHPDDAARVGTAVRDYMRAKEGAFEIEFRARRREAATRWIVLRADIDRAGPDSLRVFGIAMDVTDRHEALAALHAANARVALITRHAGIGVWENGIDRSAAIWDEQMFRLRGLAPNSFAPEREKRLALVHPDDRAQLIDAQAEFDAGSPPSAYEYRVRLPDGSWRWLASRSAPLRDEHGKVLRRVGVNWDITENKNAELARAQAASAEHASRAKSEFLSRMSHELRTPLNAVLGFTQLLQAEARRAPGGGRDGARLGHIRSAGEQLLALIDDTLELSALQSGTLTLALQPMPLAEAVAQALLSVETLAAARRVSVRAGRIEGTARADPTRLRQVLLNLLTHTVQCGRPGGEVLVDSEPRGAQVLLRMRDPGRGLTTEQLAQLFEPFSRLGREGEGAVGSGIGLTIVKAAVEGMGGRIEATSGPERGTVFELRLPSPEGADRSASDAPETTSGAELPASARRVRSGQLLYIEDNAINVLLVEELVHSLPGLRIVSEATGAAGVARALGLRPDLILVDMQLPDFDGHEVLRQLRAQPETARIPCIALSANAMPEDIERGLASGFDDYWTKPIKFRPFLDALARLFPG